MKTTTTGVLFKNADTEAMVGRIRAYPRRMVILFFSGNSRSTRCPNASLRRTPSLTKNSKATVMTPLFPNPARTSSGETMPAHINSTTMENRTSPGRSRSAISNPTMRQRPVRTIHISASDPIIELGQNYDKYCRFPMFIISENLLKQYNRFPAKHRTNQDNRGMGAVRSIRNFPSIYLFRRSE